MGGLELTNKGVKFLKEKKTIELAKLENTKITKIPTGQNSIPILSNQDQDLFGELRLTRMKLSKTANVPPYIIFHDSTLIAFAQEKPTNKEDMLEISGVGKSKYGKYGEKFLQTIIKNL